MHRNTISGAKSLYSEEDGLVRVIFFQVEPEEQSREGIFDKHNRSTQERLLRPTGRAVSSQDQEVVTLGLDFFFDFFS